MTDKKDTAAAASPSQGAGALGLALLLFLLVFALNLVRYAPPEAQAADADEARFSSGRAFEFLTKLAGDHAPRPTGSEANARGRALIQSELEGLGYSPEIQTAVSCLGRRCATVHNILARLEGTGSGGAVALVAHHDSIGSGPGAGDDASGVASLLEIARILKRGPAPSNSVFFLIVDGEEPGLLGARAFLGQHPWAGAVRAVINLEARGSSGASLMFETGPNNAAMVRHFANSVSRPVTSSVFSTIYDNMPNDTDFTIFKRAGKAGFNFAHVGGPENYHRPSDRVDRLSKDTVQHHGDNILALVTTLASADLEAPATGNAVFFDVLAWTVISWPESLALPLALVGLILLAVVLVQLFKKGQITGRRLIFALLSWWGMFLASAAAAFLLGKLLAAIGATPRPWFSPWIAQPLPLQLTYAFLVFAVSSAVARMFSRALGFWGTWAGLWLWWSVFSVVLAVALPGVSYLFMVPSIAAGCLALAAVATGSEFWRQSAAIVPATLAALLWCALLAFFLYLALGVSAMPMIAGLIGLVATTLAPLVAQQQGRLRLALPLAATVLTLVALVASTMATHYDAGTTRPLNLILYQDANSGESQWLAGGWAPDLVPDSVRQAGAFSQRGEPVIPWRRARFITGKASVDALPAPHLEVLEDTVEGDQRRLRCRFHSARGARIAALHFPPEVTLGKIVLAGNELPLRQGDSGWTHISYLTMNEEGVELDFELTSAAAFDVFLSDSSSGLPPAGDALIAAMPDSVAEMQNGHTTQVVHKVRMEPPSPDAEEETAEGATPPTE